MALLPSTKLDHWPIKCHFATGTGSPGLWPGQSVLVPNRGPQLLADLMSLLFFMSAISSPSSPKSSASAQRTQEEGGGFSHWSLNVGTVRNNRSLF